MTTPSTSLKIHNLADLPADQIDQIEQLYVTPEQEIMGKSFTESLADWRELQGQHVLGYAISHSGQMIGIVLFKCPPASPDWVAPGCASIHGLKITHHWQGRGLGHLAFRLSVDQMKRDWPDVQKLVLAVDPDNHSALRVYKAYGMKSCVSGQTGRDDIQLEIALG
ncbi:MAG: hypothetical protein Alpg2KO_16200 [Alphaproteobacteria bacterium]